jgi:hypothetical protein
MLKKENYKNTKGGILFKICKGQLIFILENQEYNMS